MNKRIILLSFLSAFLLSGCVTQKVLNHALKSDEQKNASDYDRAMTGYRKSHPNDVEWVEAFKDTFIISDYDGKRLHGIFRRSDAPTTKTAFIIHGYGCSSAEMLPYAHFYGKELGYNVFLPDVQAHGMSEGTMKRMGWLDRLDMLQWMELANSIFSIGGKDSEMVVTGVSMGGATTMMVSGEVEERGMKFVKCFVEDCGYTTVYDQFSSVVKGRFTPILNKTDKRCQRKEGWGFKEASSVSQVAKCHLPMLFIHGGSDTYVPTKMVYEVFESKPGTKEIWIPDGVRHARAFYDRNRIYKRKVKDFLERMM